MKIIVSLLLLLHMVMQPPYIGEDESSWLTNFEQAKVIAKQEEKNILLYFTGSDWCSPCKKLKKDLFETEAFQEISGSYVLVYVDIPRNLDLLSPDQLSHNKRILSEYNKKGVFPLFKIVNAKGKAMDQYSGYSMSGDVSYHMDFLKKNQ